MSKEEILKIQKCVLKVNIHCDGCKQKVKKILQKIDGVFTTDIDADQGKVTVSGNVDPAVLIKKLAKSGKHAELWNAPKPNNNNQNHPANQLKNMQIDTSKGGGGNSNKGQKCGNNQPKGGQQGQQHQLQQQQQQLQQLQQLQQMKGLQDLKLHPFKDLKISGQNPNQKAVKFNLPEDDDLTDEEFDEFDDEDYDDDFDDEFDDPELPLNKMKPAMPYSQRPNMMLNGMINGQQAQLMAAQKAGSVGGNGKKGGGGPVAVPIKMNGMNVANNGKNENGGKQGGGGHGGGGNNHSQGGGKQNGGKNGGFAQRAKNCNNGGGANSKNNSNGNDGAHGNNNGNGGKKFNGMSERPHFMSNEFQNMNGHPAMAAAAKMGAMGNMNNMSMAQMSNMSMGSIPAVQGLPAAAMNGGDGYFQGGAGPDMIAGNPYHQQQQYLAAIMNQQRAMGNDRFQPMMYARPPPAVNYMPPYPYTPHPPADPYSHYFSDENTTSSCSVM